MPDSHDHPSEAELQAKQAKKLKQQRKKAVRKAAKIRLHTCEDCGVSLVDRLKAVKHVSEHGHMAHRVCMTCKMVFINQKAFKSHCTSRKHRLNLPEGSVLPEPIKSKPRKEGRRHHYIPEPTQAEVEEKARRREEWNQLKKARDEKLRRAPEEFHGDIEFGFSCLAEEYEEFFGEDIDDIDIDDVVEAMFGRRDRGYVRC
ncbi:hypothetical protein F4821DRAFT_173594 [Hypoxylon rubiginosum]|uniref:Uncharacterized protein n=1 Tax=Hypoxylon rubiginosum TaxID=110542 RepID=A0ACC0DHD8_9PEZI|nr:hypothetical protein F4821DRAFT_173594 [Hypoxylon rubiginosum]